MDLTIRNEHTLQARCRGSIGRLKEHIAATQQSFGAGLVVQGSSIMSVLLEYSALVNAADDIDLLPLPLHLVSYGLRFSWSRHWAVDLGLARSLSPERAIRTAPPGALDLLGLPVLALTYRAGLTARSSTTYP